MAEGPPNDDLKDSRLRSLADDFNVASFASFSPSVEPRHAVLAGTPSSSDQFTDRLRWLLDHSPSGTVNVRTFAPGREKGMPFHYGLESVQAVAATVRAAAHQGLYTIVNETVDVKDGGVSGVSLGGLIEFAPDSTPRVVESGDTCSLPADLGKSVLGRVYQTDAPIPVEDGVRFEFSIHPRRVGYRAEHMLVWEREEVPTQTFEPSFMWPNPFSRIVGDKAFGLLVADGLGLAVPRTTVIGRRIAPFTFGTSPGSAEWWTRTCPSEAQPGKFTTVFGWTDPFHLLQSEDPEGIIASVLAQEGVRSLYAGATAATPDGDWIVEGIRGSGDAFMLGEISPTKLPIEVRQGVETALGEIASRIGPSRIEWAYDGDRVWIVQLHRIGTATLGAGVLSAGDAEVWLKYDPRDGLESLRHLTSQAARLQAGVEVTRPVGVTSHVGDILRKAGVPGRLARH